MEKEGWLSSRNKPKHNPKQRILRRQTSLPKKRIRPLGNFLLTQSPPPEELFKATKQSHMEQFFKPNTPLTSGADEEDVGKERLVDETGDAALEFIDESETDINDETKHCSKDSYGNTISENDGVWIKTKVAKLKDVSVSTGLTCKRKYHDIDTSSDGYEEKPGSLDSGAESTHFISEAFDCDEIVAITKRRKMCESTSGTLDGYRFNKICTHKENNICYEDCVNAKNKTSSKEERKNKVKNTVSVTDLTSLEHHFYDHSVSNQMESVTPPTDTFTLEDSNDLAEEIVDTACDSVIKEQTYKPSYLTETYNSQEKPDSETNHGFTFSDIPVFHSSDRLDNADDSTVENQTLGLQTTESCNSQTDTFLDTDHDIPGSFADTETLVDKQIEENSDNGAAVYSSLQLESQFTLRSQSQFTLGSQSQFTLRSQSQFTLRSQRELYDALEQNLATEELEEMSQEQADSGNSFVNEDNDIDEGYSQEFL